jgi:hypothetical protein
MIELEPQDPQPQDPKPSQPPTYVRGSIRQDIERERQDVQRMALDTFEMAAKSDPNVRAEAQTIARELGYPIDTAERNIDVLRAKFQREQLRKQRIAEANPYLAARTQDLEFARISHDVMDRLGHAETVTQNWTAGRFEAELGTLQHRVRIGAATDDDRARMGIVRAEIDRLAPQVSAASGAARILGQQFQRGKRALSAGAATAATAGGVALLAGQAGPQVAIPEEFATVPLATATGFGFGFLGSLAAQAAESESGASYQEMVDRGIPADRAYWISGGVGIANSLLEVGGMGVLAAPVARVVREGIKDAARKAIVEGTLSQAAIRAASAYAQGVGAEVVTEMAQEVSTAIGTSIGERGVVGTLREGAGEDLAKRVGQIGADTAQAMSLLALPGPIVQLRHDAARAAKAERTQAFVTELGTSMQEFAERSPEAAAAFVQDIAPTERVWMDARTVRDILFQRDEKPKAPGEAQEPQKFEKHPGEVVEQKLPGFLADVQAAAERGDDISMPLADYVAKVQPTLGQQLNDFVRLDPDDATSAETAEVDIGEQAKEAEKEAGESADAAKKWGEDAQGIEDSVAEQINAAGRGKAEARTNARVWRRAMETLAERIGEDVGAVAKRWSLQVERGEVAPDAQKQEGDDEITRGGFMWRDGKPLIVLTPDTNYSTFMHESSHALLDIYSQLATEKAHPTIVDDFDTFLRWAGVKDVAEWNAMSLEQRRPKHEKFAREWEAYLWRGEEPSKGLRKLFSVLKKFMRRVYESWQEITGSAPNAEIRAVMDRMLATDNEVAVAQQVRGAVDLFRDKKDADMTDEQWQAHVDARQEAIDAASDEVHRKSLRDLHWLLGKVEGMDKEMRAQAEKARKAEMPAVAAAVQSEPVYRALTWLKTGEITDASGRKRKDDTPHKLLPDTVAEQHREALRPYLSPNGVPADDAAKVLGFPSGAEMVEAVAKAPPIADAIEAKLDATMMQKHSEVFDPAKREKAIERALLGPFRKRLVASQLAILTKRPARVVTAAANKAARASMEAKRVREMMTPRAFTVAARRASMEAAEAVQAGDTAAAVDAQWRELIQTAMAQEVEGVEREIERARLMFARLDGSDKDLAKTRHIDYVQAARDLGSRFGLSEPATRQQQDAQREAGKAYIAEADPLLSARLESLLAEFPSRFDWGELLLGKFREVVDVAETLWDRARAEREIGREGKKVAAQQAASEIRKKLEGRAAITPRPEGRTAGPLETRIRDFQTWLSSFKIAESTLHGIDGEDGGPFLRHVVFPMMRGVENYNAAAKKLAPRVLDALTRAKEAAGADWLGDIHSPELDYTFRGKNELLHALAHMGSESGREKWLMGKKRADGTTFGSLTQIGDEQVVDSTDWDRFVARLWSEGRLTEADARALREVWSFFAELFEQAQKVSKEEFGFDAVALEHRQMQTPHGTLAGGYVPARTDRILANQRAPENLGDLQASQSAALYSVGPARGFMQERNPFYRQPLETNLSKLVSHMLEELRFVHLTQPANDVMRLLRSKDADGVKLRDTIAGYDRDLVDRVILPFVRNASLQTAGRPGHSRLTDEAAHFLRRASGLNALGLNLGNSLLQLTGISNSIGEIGGARVSAAGSMFAKDPAGTYSATVAASPYMQQRFDVETRQVLAQIGRVADSSPVATAKDFRDFMERIAFLPQRGTQMFVDLVTWNAARMKAIEEGHTADDAIEIADSAVRRIQGSGNPESQSMAFNAATPWVKLGYQFANYSMTVLSNVLGARSKPTAFAFNIFLPAIMQASLRLLLAPDDEEPLGEELAENLAVELGRNTLGLVPVAGPFAMGLLQSDGRRVQGQAATSTIADVYRGIIATMGLFDDEPTTEAQMRSMATMWTVITGAPLGAPTRQVLTLAGDR